MRLNSNSRPSRAAAGDEASPPPSPADPEAQLQCDELAGQPLWFLLLVIAGWLLASLCFWWPGDFCRWLRRQFRRRLFP